MSTVLVTGGAGYIGSHVCKALSVAGHKPVAFDDFSYGHDWAVQWGPLERGNITDRAALDAAIARHAPTAVIHLAAFASVGESVANPGLYYRNNVQGTLTLAEAMRDHGIGPIVFSSSAAVYGVPETVPIVEDAPKLPINPYGRTKLISEGILQDFAQPHGLRSVSLRYFNVVGADPDGEIGEAHDPETHILPNTLYAAAGVAPTLSLFGDDYPTEDGTCVRDYIHVSDLATAHVQALAYLEAGGAPVGLNLGIGRGYSVKQVITVAEAVTGRKVPVTIQPRRPGDPPALVAAADRAGTVIGFQPRFTALEDIVATAWNWHRKRPPVAEAVA